VAVAGTGPRCPRGSHHHRRCNRKNPLSVPRGWGTPHLRRTPHSRPETMLAFTTPWHAPGRGGARKCPRRGRPGRRPFTAPESRHPTCAQSRLLGPCFKTGGGWPRFARLQEAQTSGIAPPGAAAADPAGGPAASARPAAAVPGRPAPARGGRAPGPDRRAGRGPSGKT